MNQEDLFFAAFRAAIVATFCLLLFWYLFFEIRHKHKLKPASSLGYYESMASISRCYDYDKRSNLVVYDAFIDGVHSIGCAKIMMHDETQERVVLKEIEEKIRETTPDTQGKEIIIFIRQNRIEEP